MDHLFFYSVLVFGTLATLAALDKLQKSSPAGELVEDRNLLPENPWRAPAESVIFLDFDGVLSPGQSESFELRPAFEDVMRQFPDVDVVISSSWRRNCEPDYLKHRFSSDIAPRIAGVTPQLEGHCVRSREIEAYVKEWGVRRWIAVDDTPSLFWPECDYLLETSASRGLGEAKLAELAERIGRWDIQLSAPQK